jgi:hypothetical protein
VDISGTIGRKLDALRAHASPLKDFDRVEQSIREWSAEVGKEIGVAAAEGFHVVVIDDDDDADEDGAGGATDAGQTGESEAAEAAEAGSIADRGARS